MGAPPKSWPAVSVSCIRPCCACVSRPGRLGPSGVEGPGLICVGISGLRAQHKTVVRLGLRGRWGRLRGQAQSAWEMGHRQ